MAVTAGQVVETLVGLVVFGGLAVFVVVRSVQKAEDPGWMIFRVWVLTLGMLGVLLGVVAPIVARGDEAAAWVGVPGTALCGLVLAIVWGRSIGALASKPLTALYDGGNVPPDPHPAYSVALARQKRGQYLEAVQEVRKQLARFPTDVEGHLLLAQFQAENLHDLAAAELTIQRFCEQPGHAPQNIVFALYSMADWHLAVGQDPEAARRHLERVIELMPDSEAATGAAQRIAHLASPEMLLAPEERKKFIVPEGVKNLGLMRSQAKFQPKEEDPAERAAAYVKHLEEHPLDTEAREQLAVLYADHYQRLDLATSELEGLIGAPNQPGRLVVHWLNLLADLQVRSGADYDTVRQTLQRIIDRGPNLAPAEIARNRLALLKLEMKAKAKNASVQMGTYEQNLGLKQGLSRRR